MHLKSLLFAAICLLSSGQAAAQATDGGVTLELAQQRSAAQLRGLQYALTFNLPEQTSQPVTGTVSISFELQDKQEVVLDFLGRLTGSATVNGKKRQLQQADGHIVIPKKLTRRQRNVIELQFESQDASLNRHADYMYTLLVPDHARTLFPCFDQPDMKATFSVELNAPVGWRTISSCGTKPISTYLFSFVAGRFQEYTAERDGHTLRALYRETDPRKVAQLDQVMDEAALSLRWMEQYTGMKMPFDTYGLVILPGYQFGGMEHPGAIQLSDREVFLGESPTQDEQLRRLELIAHETAHLWFGDLVTMRWFDDVWTKEVFANFLAAKVTCEQFPGVNHDLNFLKIYQARAIKTDRTEGSHPIRQALGNLNQASLLYGNIIYDKAPVVMRKLEEQMGEQSLRTGLQLYLQKYAYKNASWDDLIRLLDEFSPSSHVRQFSDVWVQQRGLPTIETTYDDGRLIIRQRDPNGRQLVWPQKFTILVGYDLQPSRIYTIDLQEPAQSIRISPRPNYIIPNYNGRGYGRFTLDKEYTQALIKRLMCERNDLSRYALTLTLYDNYLQKRIDPSYFGELYRTMENERNPLVLSTATQQMMRIAFDSPAEARQTLELCLLDLSRANRLPACRQNILRLLGSNATSPVVLDTLYNIWRNQSEPLLNERDYINLSYRLAIMRPAEWQDIVATQRARLRNADRQREYDYVSRGCTPDVQAQRALFDQLLAAENRTSEPWARKLLGLLCCDVREQQSNAYITPGLEALQQIQRTSDIFFPGYWLTALLADHRSPQAKQAVRQFLDSRPDYPQNLKNKILEAAFPLLNH